MSDKTKQRSVVEEFERAGFTVEHCYPGEYILMKGANWNTVRVYETGVVWIKDPTTGVYKKREELNNG